MANISKYHSYLAYIPVNKRRVREWWKYQGYLIVQELEYKNSGKLSASHLLDISQIQHQRGQMKVLAVHGKSVLQSGHCHPRNANMLQHIGVSNCYANKMKGLETVFSGTVAVTKETEVISQSINIPIQGGTINAIWRRDAEN